MAKSIEVIVTWFDTIRWSKSGKPSRNGEYDNGAKNSQVCADAFIDGSGYPSETYRPAKSMTYAESKAGFTDWLAQVKEKYAGNTVEVHEVPQGKLRSKP